MGSYFGFLERLLVQNICSCVQSHLGTHKMSYAFINAWKKIGSSTFYSSLGREHVKKRTPVFLKENVSQEESQNRNCLFDEAYSQAKHCISLIKDPLWKHVCTEVINMMGPLSVLKVWDSRLGTLSSQEKVIDLSCQTEESAQFLEQYNFVIISILQQYFPALKELQVTLNSK